MERGGLAASPMFQWESPICWVISSNPPKDQGVLVEMRCHSARHNGHVASAMFATITHKCPAGNGLVTVLDMPHRVEP